MGVLPLEFLSDEGAVTCGLRGDELLSIEVPDDLAPGSVLEVRVQPGEGGQAWGLLVRCRLDSDADIEYYRAGGILPRVFGLLAAGGRSLARRSGHV